ncbi:DUF4132 domain-containing protein [Flavobacterium orientale]|uniref:DUF4132 domain-containing protein n=1 Tax=Flavobacterium orientale TaxID=1756020 RepID=A0A916Y9F0_9FLAO|nr:DUF4132 domain-containing protein [Flavobacterium orientale]GGD35235.1 hypothetical protein GCM10011343_26360 [Flavobacterium orientale]
MGIINKLKTAIGLSRLDNSLDNTEFKAVFNTTVEEYAKHSKFFYTVAFAEVPAYNNVVKKWDDEKKGEFVLFLTNVIKNNYLGYNRGVKKESDEFQMASQMIHNLFRSKLKLSETIVVTIYDSFKKNVPEKEYNKMYWWPLAGFYKQIENNFKPVEAPVAILEILNDILRFKKDTNSYYYKDQIKLEEKIKAFLFANQGNEGSIKPTYFVGEDGFQSAANALLDQQKEEDRKLWYKLVTLAQKATGSKPTQKYLNEAKAIIDQLGADKFKKVTQEWFNQVINLKETVTTHTQVYNKSEYTYNITEFLTSLNSEAIKGFVWMSSWFYDNTTVQTISKLAERCFKKIPEKGPAAAGIGNACLYTLYASKGLDGIAQLSRLRLKIKQNNTLTLIEKYIDEAAVKLGISSIEIEDLAVDDFKLKSHQLTYVFEEYTAVLAITGTGKSSLKWFKPDGSEQKTVPQLVKDKFSAKLTKIKATQKQIDQTTAAQKERFDRMLRSNRTMSIEYVKEKYMQHGLLSFAINKVIFKFSNAQEEVLAIFLNNQWVTVAKEVIDIDKYKAATLWHPATSSTNEVKEWRQFLMTNQIQQPFKQAYREIYLLTDAEVNTRTYSNRMASHILKQHQYVTLAKGRNWRARLIGAWDGGDQDTAQLLMPEYNLTVEYWVNALNADDEFNATGIWNYVTTDQIRFVNTQTNDLIALVDVPPVAFSEAMRDIDLFVGVASVGNDPTWSDSGGLPTYRDYWQSYSFGDLSEIAKNRKEILQGLIPRLKIASVASIEDKFVVVKGKIRTYKIHIGSTNILMEPNDQYLCIVPDRSKKDNSENLFLPFEGDNGLSVIISKALLLANDDKITDRTITSQINR